MYTCRDCGEEFERDDIYYLTDTDDYVCEDCWSYDSYMYCEQCGDRFSPNTILNYVDERDEYLCDCCYHNYCESQEHGVASYHSFQDSGKEWTPILGEGEEDSPLLIKTGFELEVVGPNSCDLEDVANYLREHFSFIADIEHDGSVSHGFEIITYPMSKKGLIRITPEIKECTDYLNDLGFKSHNTSCCGLHVHTTRSAYGDTQEKQERNIERLILFTEFYKNELKAFSRRNDYGYCSFTSDLSDIDKIYLKSSKILKSINDNHNRYQVINNENSETVEIRVFRGTLKFETLMATLDFVHQLVLDLVTKNNNNQISWDSVVKNSKSTYLKEYCESKQIFNSQKLNDEKYNISKLLKIRATKIKMLNDNYNQIINDTISKLTDLISKIDIKKALETNEDMFGKIAMLRTLTNIVEDNYRNKANTSMRTDREMTDYELVKFRIKELNSYYNRANQDLIYIGNIPEDLKEDFDNLKQLVKDNYDKLTELISNNNTNGEQ